MARATAAKASKFIVINGRRMWLAHTRPGAVRGLEGDSEQCEDCGSDIAESGTMDRAGVVITCECGCRYGVLS